MAGKKDSTPPRGQPTQVYDKSLFRREEVSDKERMLPHEIQQMIHQFRSRSFFGGNPHVDGVNNPAMRAIRKIAKKCEELGITYEQLPEEMQDYVKQHNLGDLFDLETTVMAQLEGVQDDGVTVAFEVDRAREEGEKLGRLRILAQSVDQMLDGVFAGSEDPAELHEYLVTTHVTLPDGQIPLTSALIELVRLSHDLEMTLDDFAGPALLRYADEVDSQIGEMFLRNELPQTQLIDLGEDDTDQQRQDDERTVMAGPEVHFDMYLDMARRAMDDPGSISVEMVRAIIAHLEQLQHADPLGRGRNERRIPPDIHDWMNRQRKALVRKEGDTLFIEGGQQGKKVNSPKRRGFWAGFFSRKGRKGSE